MIGARRAILETRAPEGAFTLRGVIPCPKPGRILKRKPYDLAVFHDGRMLESQVELGARAPGSEPRAATLEVLAHVPEGTVAQGEIARFDVLEVEHPTHPVHAEEEFAQFPVSPWNAALVLTDTHGRRWIANLTGGDGAPTKYHRVGPVVVQARTANELRLAGPAREGDPPHSGGVKAWWSVSKMRHLELALEWNQGLWPPVGDVYFEKLELVLAPGWTAVPFWDEPAVRSVPFVDSKGRLHLEIVTALEGNQANLMPASFSRRWRFAVSRLVEPMVRGLDALAGWAVCQPAPGLWSWASPTCFGFQPIGAMMSTGVLDEETVEREWLSETSEVEEGLPDFEHPDAVPPLHWCLTKNVGYGGATGGDEVDAFSGSDVLDTGNLEGYLGKLVEFTRWACRQRSFWGRDGEALTSEFLLEQTGGAFTWRIDNQRVRWGKEGPLDHRLRPGLSLAEGWSRPWYADRMVGVPGAPEWEQGMDPIDDQHAIRAHEAATFLAWAGNDPVAIEFLQAEAELARMSRHEKWHDGYGGWLQRRREKPGIGGGGGRAEAWRLNVVTNAFVFGTNAFRNRFQAWIVTALEILELAQTPAGLVGGEWSGKIAQVVSGVERNEDVTHVGTRTNEEAYLAFACLGAARMVWSEDFEPHWTYRHVARRIAKALWAFSWKSGTNAWITHSPVGPIEGPPYSRRDEIPAEFWQRLGTDSFQVPVGMVAAYLSGAELAACEMVKAFTGKATVRMALRAVLDSAEDMDDGTSGGLVGLAWSLLHAGER